MGESTGIEWTDSTWNPIRARRLIAGILDKHHLGWHCEHVSEGCRNCYAENMNRRLGTGLDFKPGHRADIEIFLDEKMLLAPLRWKKPRRIFVNSMTDTFAEFVADDMLDRVFAVMALASWHQFQVLTKRPARMLRHLTNPQFGNYVEIFPWPLPNVWLGVSAEDQAAADERIPLLLATPAAVRFVSLEPLLGPINLTVLRARHWARGQCMNGLTGTANPSLTGMAPTTHLDWVIAGGESGRNARPMRIEWVRSLRDQCAAADIPYFFKQWGEHRPDDPTANRTAMVRVGKKAAGRLLDGGAHDAMPPSRLVPAPRVADGTDMGTGRESVEP